MLLRKKKDHGLQLCLYFCLLQMVLRHCDVGGIFYRYVDYCGVGLGGGGGGGGL